MKNDQWRTWFTGYFQDVNPWAPEDESKREWIELAWEIAACCAFLGFMAWLGLGVHAR